MSNVGGPGRRSKGDRAQIGVRPPTPQKRFYEARAQELGISLGTYAVLRLAEVHNLEIPEFVREELAQAAERRRNGEDELDLGGGSLPMARSA